MSIEEPTSASRSDRIDVELRSLDDDFCQCLELNLRISLTFRCGRLEHMLQLARVPRYIRTGPSHIHGNQWRTLLVIVASLAVADHASCRSTQDGPQPGKVVPGTQSSVRLHEEQLVPECLETTLKA